MLKLLLTCLAFMAGWHAIAQNVRIQGRVTSDKNDTLTGVSVKIKNQPRGVLTNESGVFSLTAPRNTIVEISFVGYASQEIKVTGETFLNIILKEGSNALEDMVVVGYQSVV